MNKNFSPLHLYLNNQSSLLEDKIVSIIDPKTISLETIEYTPFLEHEQKPMIKIGNVYTVPFFKK